jgi:hypothetical protein
MFLSTNQIQLQNKVDINDVYRSIKEKLNKKKESYEILLEKIYKKIQKTADRNRYNCQFEIPSFVIGYPIYDMNRCIAYIISNVRKSGFIAKFIYPNMIYISWSLDEIKKERDNNLLNKKLLLEKMIEQNTKPVKLSLHDKSLTQNLSLLTGNLPINTNTLINNHQMGSARSDQNRVMSEDQIIGNGNFLEDFNFASVNDTHHWNTNYSTNETMPIHIPIKLPSPISTNKRLEYHPENLKYDPNNLTLPIYREKDSHLSGEKNKHPFFGVSKKYNSNGKIVLDLS